eukprot:TRINITY_DN549_c0_g1_i6.p1 TRINITY_DN549_c0_g1~~TRINITY_DN549_c0_g1_i6.p1  ORF type:complete len:414 (+),score=47.29 TRINITY_DN549_c0_g1_i6:488-1729(+)
MFRRLPRVFLIVFLSILILFITSSLYFLSSLPSLETHGIAGCISPTAAAEQARRLENAKAEIELLKARIASAPAQAVPLPAQPFPPQPQLPQVQLVPQLPQSAEPPHFLQSPPVPQTPQLPQLIPAPVGAPSLPGGVRVAVIVFCYDRHEYLDRTMQSIMKYLPAENFPVIISQDGDIPAVKDVIHKYPRVAHVTRWDRSLPPKERASDLDAYYHISMHYKFGLTQVFDVLQFDAAIVLEDDMEIAPDFFEYFAAMLPLLRSDTSLLCVSAWNDNGQQSLVSDPKAVHRSDFFPGLGWMLLRSLWQELRPRWPNAYWDDWLRNPEQRLGRQCIRPEVSRTYTFGAHGSSQGQFFDRYLRPIKLNDQMVLWSQEDLSHLSKDKYDVAFMGQLASARQIALEDLVTYAAKQRPRR